MTYQEAIAILEGRKEFGYARKLSKPNPNRDRVKVANNTWLDRSLWGCSSQYPDNSIGLMLHSTYVVIWTPRWAEFRTDGFHTVTTADRISYGPGSVGSSKNGWQWIPYMPGTDPHSRWRALDHDNAFIFYDGLRVKNDGSGILKTQPNKPQRFEPIYTRSGFSGLTSREATQARNARFAPRPQVATLRQSDIAACPFVIIEPSHYRPDGSCKCNDPIERERMKRDWEYTNEDFANAGLIEGVTN